MAGVITPATASTAPPNPPAPIGSPGSGPPGPVRRLLSAVGVIVVLVAAVIGANPGGIRDRLFAGPATAAPPPPPPAPQWRGVVSLRGTGATASAPFFIPDGTTEWRVRWTCQSGTLIVQSPGRARPVVDAACPGTGIGFATETGTRMLQVTTDGPWQLDVEQRLPPPAPAKHR
jgi:hypothetical protein